MKTRDIPSIPEGISPDLKRVLMRMREEIQKGIATRAGTAASAFTGTGMGTGGGVTIINPPGGGGGGVDPDLTPPPSPASFTAQSGIFTVILTWEGITYTQGRGNKQTVIYGVQRDPSDPSLPVFADASIVAVAPHALTVFALPSNANTRWHLWAKFETNDGVLSVDPAGGINGVTVTTGQDVAELLEILQGEIAASQLAADLASRIDLIDANELVTGSVAWRVKQEADARAAAFIQEAADRTQAIALSAQASADALAQETIDRSAAILAEQQARASAIGSVQTGLQSEIDDLSNSVDAQITLVRSDFASADAATLASAQSFTYARATIDGAIAAEGDSVRAAFAVADAETLASAQSFTYSRATIDEAFTSQSSTLTAAFSAADATTLASANDFTYSRATIDGAISASLTTLRAEFAAADDDVLDAAESYVQAYGYTFAGADSAIATAVNTVSARLNAGGDVFASIVSVENTAQAALDGLDTQATQITTLQSAVNLRNRTFRQANPPVSDSNYTLQVNDRWIETDNGNKEYAWNGTAWVDAGDVRIASTLALLLNEYSTTATINDAIATASTTLTTAFTNADATVATNATNYTNSYAYSRADVDGQVSSVASSVDTLAVQLRGNYTGNDLGAVTTGLIHQERTARVTLGNSLTQQISLLSAGSNNQFDFSDIWYYDTTVDGWNGPVAGTTTSSVDGWLRLVANSGSVSNAYVQSPDNLGVDGAKYPQVRMRIRKIGSPTWEGKVYFTTTADNTYTEGKAASVTEPAYDNGIALLTFDMPATWTSATIRRIRVDLSTATTTTAYFEIDWVAIGRPSPGASSAQLLEEQQARIDGDAAQASARETLATQLRGGYTGTDITAVSTGLIASERNARVTADSSEVTARQALSSKVTGVNDPASLTLATLSSGLLYDERQARTTADNSQVSRIESLEATVDNPGTGVVATAGALSTLSAVVNNSTTGLSATATKADLLQSRIATRTSIFSESWEDANALARWESVVGSGEITIASVTDSLIGAKVLRIGNNAGNDERWLIHRDLIPFDPAKTYRITARVRRLSGTANLRIGFAGVGSNGTTYVNTTGANNSTTSQHYHGNSSNVTGTGWVTVVGFSRGFGASAGTTGAAPNIATPGQMHPSVRYIRPLIAGMVSSATGSIEVASFVVEDAEARVVQGEVLATVVSTTYTIAETNNAIAQADLAVVAQIEANLNQSTPAYTSIANVKTTADAALASGSTNATNITNLQSRIEGSGPNLLQNGSFEVYTGTNGIADGWVAYHSGTTAGRVWSLATDRFTHGARSQRVAATSVGATTNDRIGVRFGTTTLPAGAVGKKFTASVSVAGTAGARGQLYFDFFDAGGAFLSGSGASGTATLAGPSTFQRLVASRTVPANSAGFRFYAWLDSNPGGGAAEFYADSAQFQEGDLTGFQMPDITAALQQESTTRASETGVALAQWTLKTDVNGYVAGFGLSNTPNNGNPFADFQIRADRFSITNPATPQANISSLTRSGTTATLNTSTAHGLVVGDDFTIRGVTNDTNWNSGFKVLTRPSTTQITFTVPNTLTTPATVTGAKLGKATIPFIVDAGRVVIDAAYIVNLSAIYGQISSLVADSIAAATITAAQFTGGTMRVGSFIASTNYTSGAGGAGFRLNADGTAELQAAYIRGQLVAGQINGQGLTIRAASDNSIILDAGGTGALTWNKVSGSGRPADFAQPNDPNIAADPQFVRSVTDTTLWSRSTGQITVNGTQGEGNTPGLRIDSIAAIRDSINAPYIPARQGDVLYIRARVFLSAGFPTNNGVGVGVYEYTAAFATNSNFPRINVSNATTGTWQLVTGQITLGGASTQWVRVYLTMRETVPAGHHAIFSDVYVSKVQFGATVGAPAGTLVGNTAATTVETGAANGATALAAINDATTGLNARLRNNANDVLGGIISVNAVTAPAGFRAGSITWNAAGDYVSGAGVAMTPKGIVAYGPMGGLAFALNAATGAATFAGDISGSTGNFVGSVSIGGRTWTSGNGIWLGVNGGHARAFIGSDAQHLKYDAQTGLLTLKLAAMTITATPANLSAFVQNGGQNYGSVTVSVTGGEAPYTYQWSLLEGGPAIVINGGAATATCSFGGSGTNTILSGIARCVVIDANGRAGTVGIIISATHGMPP